VPLREIGLGGVLVALVVFLQVRTGSFLDAGNLTGLATEAALLACCALPAALVLLGGAIDISLGSMMALSAAVAGRLWQNGQPLPVVVAGALGVGAAAGCLNAILTLAGRVHPIVVTLGTLSLYRGAAVWWLQESDVILPGPARLPFTTPVAGLLPVVWIALVLALGLALFLGRTVWGRQLYAVGSNAAAAQRLGISRARSWLLAFTVQGMLLGLAALLYLARSGQLQQVSHEDRTLEAIAAAVVGGVAVTGGRGTVVGVVLGCLFLATLGPACLHLDVPTIWRQSLVGAVMAVAVTLDALWRRRSDGDN
jgi:ribose/xylose/arabinose/galactoside ABC-type transport system permease subunit